MNLFQHTFFVLQLDKAMFQDFLESTTTRRYSLWISADAYVGLSGQFTNRDTSEVLVISLYGTDATTRSVEVARFRQTTSGLCLTTRRRGR